MKKGGASERNIGRRLRRMGRKSRKCTGSKNEVFGALPSHGTLSERPKMYKIFVTSFIPE